ncbi:hypothetical protein OHS33_39140 (plasmid) [Streptomyces sp. NBC_00536]|uniref:hypothetical protein n=1 Tax=Streptomyces sp. NBC_00536 TaxID=2975769 RepID=UPI002E80D1E2|nr:hypothetical protein [Streptomyces sp. NBC_00536]WUC84375.1 hypothetical protein OHS33_39140 [Streptomyces sp. NBC_00536]
MNPATLPQLDAPSAVSRPLDAAGAAYLLANADRPEAAVPVSGSLVRSVLGAALRSGGAAALDPADGSMFLTYGQSAGTVPGLLGPVFRAVPCERPPLTPCCARCGHWRSEHDHPAVPTACTRYRLNIGPARYALPEHSGVTYAWTRRLGRTRVRFEISEPTDRFPGGVLSVHRFPAQGDGPYAYSAHFAPIPEERRAAVLKRAHARVHPQPCN